MDLDISIDFRTVRRLALAAFWVMCLAFSFDLQHGVFEGGWSVQLLFVSLVLFFTAGIPLLAFGARHLMTRPACYLFLAWGFFLLYSAAVSLPQEGVPKFLYFRVVLVFVMCWFGMGAVLVLAGLGFTMRQVFIPLLVSAFVAAIFRFVTGLQTGIALEHIRIQILGPSLMFLFAYGAAGMVLARRVRPSAALAFLTVFAIAFISITRWLLIDAFAAFAVSGLLLFLIVVWGGYTMRDIGLKAVQGIVAAAALVFAIGAFIAANPVALERWETRMVEAFEAQTSKPLTLLTREAEAAGMYQQLGNSPLRWAFGRGIAARFGWPTSYYPEFLSVMPNPEGWNFSDDFHFVGHSMWRYAIFSTGIFGLLFYIALFVFGGFSALRLAYLAAKSGGSDDVPYELALLPLVFLCVIGVDSLTNNAFAERYQAVVTGVMVVFPQLGFASLRRRAQEEAMAAAAIPPGGFQGQIGPPAPAPMPNFPPSPSPAAGAPKGAFPLAPIEPWEVGDAGGRPEA